MNKMRKNKYWDECISAWLMRRGAIFWVIVALMDGSTKARADEAIWNADGSYAGHITDNGSYDSVWGVNGGYKGHIDKDWVNPHVPRIDRGRE